VTHCCPTHFLSVFTALHIGCAVYALILCLSQCLCLKTFKHGIMQIMLHNSPGTQVFWCQRSWWNFNGVTPYKGLSHVYLVGPVTTNAIVLLKSLWFVYWVLLIQTLCCIEIMLSPYSSFCADLTTLFVMTSLSLANRSFPNYCLCAFIDGCILHTSQHFSLPI